MEPGQKPPTPLPKIPSTPGVLKLQYVNFAKRDSLHADLDNVERFTMFAKVRKGCI